MQGGATIAPFIDGEEVEQLGEERQWHAKAGAAVANLAKSFWSWQPEEEEAAEPEQRPLERAVGCNVRPVVVARCCRGAVPTRGGCLIRQVHGVRAEFLAIGAAIKRRDAGAYLLGKALCARTHIYK